MKRWMLIWVILFNGPLIINGQVKSYKDIIGRWEIVGEELPGANLEVIDSTKIFLTYMGERKQVTSPVLNTKKNPAWFDFTITDSASGPMNVKTLITVYGDGVMKWQLFIDEERSNYFSASRGELMYLRRSKAEPGAVASQE